MKQNQREIGGRERERDDLPVGPMKLIRWDCDGEEALDLRCYRPSTMPVMSECLINNEAPPRPRPRLHSSIYTEQKKELTSIAMNDNFQVSITPVPYSDYHSFSLYITYHATEKINYKPHDIIVAHIILLLSIFSYQLFVCHVTRTPTSGWCFQGEKNITIVVLSECCFMGIPPTPLSF